MVVSLAAAAFVFAGGVVTARAGAHGTPDSFAMDVLQDPRTADHSLRSSVPGAAGPHTADPASELDDARRSVTTSSPTAPVPQQILNLVNVNRRQSGCDPLSLDTRLIEAANKHAADMARGRYLAHESPNGEGAGDRVSNAGYLWNRYAENLARGADSPYQVVAGWMQSPPHRRNILDCRMQQTGVGLAIADDRTPYWVEDFATPRLPSESSVRVSAHSGFMTPYPSVVAKRRAKGERP